METTLKTKQGDFKLRSTFKGNKKAQWSNAKNENWNNHLISVAHKGKKTSFEFWGSIMNPEVRKPQELAHAFYCFLSDALSAKDSFKNFCSEFGYDSDIRTAERIYKACEKTLGKFERLFDGDAYELMNEIQERYNC